jgi:dolichol-phosphate mannosyltransferase
MNEHGTFLRGMVSWVGFRQCPYPFKRAERFAGETKYPLKKMLKLAMDGIFSFSTAPIRVLLLGGLGMGLFGFLYWLLTLIFSWGSTHVLLSALFIFTGLLFCGMFVLGEYIGRTYEETMNRPLYLIARTVGFDDERIR